MSKITNIYNSIHTEVTSILTDHIRLPDPYNLDQNNEQFLKLGYGVTIGAAENTNRTVCNAIWLARDYQIRLTQRVIAREFDAATKGIGEKTILEYMKSLYNHFYKQDLAIADATLVNILGDDGMESIYVDEMAFISMSMNLTVEYNETLT